MKLSPIPFGSTKQDIKVALLHVSQPSYVDFNSANSYSIVRFPCQTTAEGFVTSYSSSPFLIKDAPINIDKLTKEEEIQYFKMINAKRERFQRQKSEAKKKMITEKIPPAEPKKKRTATKNDLKKKSAVMTNFK